MASNGTPSTTTSTSFNSNISTAVNLDSLDEENLTSPQTCHQMYGNQPFPPFVVNNLPHGHFIPTHQHSASQQQAFSDQINSAIRVPPNLMFRTPPNSPQDPGAQHSPGGGGAAPPSSGNSHFDALKQFFETSLPFVILLFTKISFDHKTGIMFFFAMYGTFLHCNLKAVDLMLPRKLRSPRELARGTCSTLAIVIVSTFLIYYAFADQHLYRSLYFVLPDIGQVNVWGLLWVVGVTDFVIKFVTVSLKLLINVMPSCMHCSRKKGQWYQLVETISQSYRSVVPITPWVYFLLDDSNSGYWLSLILLVIYMIFKALDLFSRGKELWSSVIVFCQKSVIGTSPGRFDLESAGTNCPICHDAFESPVKLSCHHIFCEECITTWFDREPTCPMCRSKMLQMPRWRDGRTSASLQFF